MEKVRILVCDDEQGVRDSLKLILEPEYELSYVANGEEAVEHLRANPADLLILDVKMPRMGGVEALQKIKRVRPRLKVLMITGYESHDVAAQATKFGADDYLTKPFESKKVLAKIQALLGK
jgi:DNA-binding NtrC family response regulator